MKYPETRLIAISPMFHVRGVDVRTPELVERFKRAVTRAQQRRNEPKREVRGL